MFTAVSGDSESARLHHYCKRCSSALRSSHVLRGSSRRNEEVIQIYNGNNFELEILKDCHFCTHIFLAYNKGLQQLKEPSSGFEEIGLDITRTTDASGRPPVRLTITYSTQDAHFEQELWVSFQAGAGEPICIFENFTFTTLIFEENIMCIRCGTRPSQPLMLAQHTSLLHRLPI